MGARRFKRLMDIPQYDLLSKLEGNLLSLFARASYDKIGSSEEMIAFELMGHNITTSKTNSSLLVMVKDKNGTTIEGMFSLATFVSDDDMHCVIVIDERNPSTISGMISEVFENLKDEYTSKIKKGEVKNNEQQTDKD